MLPIVNGEFRIVDEPTLRFTPGGKAVAGCRIVANSRRQNPETKEWENADECWLNLTIWDQPAENFIESVTKGDLIFVSGPLKTRSYEKDGEKRQSYDVTAYVAAPVLRYATAKVTKVQRSGGQQQGQQQDGGTQPQQGGQQAAQPAAVDPWATPTPGDEPPF